MKYLISFLLFVSLAICGCTQKQSFDIVSYTAPKGWQKLEKTETITFSKEDATKGFCMITIYKSIDASDNAQQNFDLAWQSLVKENLGVATAAEMQPATTENGWTTLAGHATFEKDNISGAVILASSTAGNKLSNMIIVTNSGQYEKEITAFIESMTLKKPTTATTTVASTKTNSPAATPQVWMLTRYSMEKRKDESLWLVLYSNGDFLGHLPEGGMLGVTKANSNQTNSWGVIKDKGAELHLENAHYGTVIRLGKTSSTEMSYPPGSKSSVYKKCKSVDGLTLEGAYTPDFDLYNKAKAGVTITTDPRPIIFFKKDGTFINEGVAYSNITKSGTYAIGKGKYFIKDYSLILTFDDGRKVQVAFTGILGADPFTNPDGYMINGLTNVKLGKEYTPKN